MKLPFLISCKKTTYLISKQQETKNTFKEKVQLFIHLFICNVCSLYKKQSNYILMLLKQKSQEPHHLTQDAKQKIKTKVDEAINNNN
jgi:predicted oxidoreductase (fatty acid repression mutant protein)